MQTTLQFLTSALPSVQLAGSMLTTRLFKSCTAAATANQHLIVRTDLLPANTEPALIASIFLLREGAGGVGSDGAAEQ